MAITDKKALDCAKTLKAYCEEQRGCENCILRLHAPDHWNCEMRVMYADILEIESNYKAKRMHHGFITP